MSCQSAREPGPHDHAGGADGQHQAARCHVEADGPHEIVGDQEKHAEGGEVDGNARGSHDGEIDVAEEGRPDDGLGMAALADQECDEADERQKTQAEARGAAENCHWCGEGEQQRAHPADEQGGAERVEAACRAVPGRGREEAR